MTDVPFGWEPSHRVLYDKLLALEEQMAFTQQSLDNYAAEVERNAQANADAHTGLSADIAALAQEIEDLKATLPPEIDTSKMDAALGKLQTSSAALTALDEQNPPAPPA